MRRCAPTSATRWSRRERGRERTWLPRHSPRAPSHLEANHSIEVSSLPRSVATITGYMGRPIEGSSHSARRLTRSGLVSGRRRRCAPHGRAATEALARGASLPRQRSWKLTATVPAVTPSPAEVQRCERDGGRSLGGLRGCRFVGCEPVSRSAARQRPWRAARNAGRARRAILRTDKQHPILARVEGGTQLASQDALLMQRRLGARRRSPPVGMRRRPDAAVTLS